MGTRSLIAIAALWSVGTAAQPAPLIVDVDARSVQPGEVVLVTVTAPPAARGMSVRAFNRQIQAFAVGAGKWEAIVGIDLDDVRELARALVQARLSGGEVPNG